MLDENNNGEAPSRPNGDNVEMPPRSANTNQGGPNSVIQAKAFQVLLSSLEETRVYSFIQKVVREMIPPDSPPPYKFPELESKIVEAVQVKFPTLAPVQAQNYVKNMLILKCVT